MKKIPLTQGKFAIVDDEDYEFLMQWKWYCKDGYAVRKIRTVSVNGKEKFKTFFMHRVVMNAPEEMYIDHVKFDRLDNRKSNLRICTHKENSRNRNKQKNNTSGFKGVHLKNKTWHSRIKVNGVTIHLGVFINPVDAAKAYNEAALKHFGEFANLNSVQ